MAAIPRPLLMGHHAAMEAVRRMKAAHALRLSVKTPLGATRLIPGTQWDGDRVFVDGDGAGIRYLIGDTLFESGASDFVTQEWHRGLERVMMTAGAAWDQRLPPQERHDMLDFVLALNAALGVPCARGMRLCTHYQQQFASLRAGLPMLAADLNALRTRAPTLFGLVLEKAGGVALSPLPKQLDLREARLWLVRSMKGQRQSFEDFERLFYTLYALAQALSTTGHSVSLDLASLNKNLAWRKVPVQVSESDAASITSELRGGDCVEVVKRLQSNLGSFLPHLKRVATGWPHVP